jgi:uncharacterized protein (DUF58 family)
VDAAVLSRQGWLVGAGGLGLVALGRLLGVFELFILGGVALALVAVALLLVASTRLRLEVGRELHPPRVYAGTPSRVDLRVRNLGDRPTPVLRLVDPVSGTRGAELLVAPLEPQAISRAAYRLPTERRGVLHVGPLRVTIGDPFGLTSLALQAAPRTDLTIFPRIDDIVAVPHTSGHDPHAGAEHATSLGRTGEDFYGLRTYVVGDDLRRVHWPSTARRDDLMVRQDELPWQGRVTVLLDVRRSTHSPESLELAVSAAASVVTASWRRRDLVRVLSTDGQDSGFAAGHAHVESVMEHLAVIRSVPGGTLRGVLNLLNRGAAGGGALVVVVADLPPAELQAVVRLRGGFGALTIVQFDRSSWDPAAEPVQAVASPALMRIVGGTTFAEVWNRTMSRRRRPGGVPLGTTVPGVRA